MTNSHKLYIAGVILLIAGGICFRGIVRNAPAAITVYTGSTFTVPSSCKHLALLGCTPHPTGYLIEKGSKSMESLELSDFLDGDQLIDSFKQVFELCKEHSVDHLIIAYLPIYFVEMKQILQDQFIPYCRAFLDTIAPQVATHIQELKNKVAPNLRVSLVLPETTALIMVPCKKVSDDDRVRYSIKQFPRLEGEKKALETISIINNKDSGQNEDILRYLKYDYLFEKPFQCKVFEIAKKKFHTYKAPSDTQEHRASKH